VVAATGIQQVSFMDPQVRSPGEEAASLQGKSVGVVGAGIAGLVAASRMASMGCEVSVFDLGRGPGGQDVPAAREGRGSQTLLSQGERRTQLPARLEPRRSQSSDPTTARSTSPGQHP